MCFYIRAYCQYIFMYYKSRNVVYNFAQSNQIKDLVYSKTRIYTNVKGQS